MSAERAARERLEWMRKSHRLGVESAIMRHHESLRVPAGIDSRALLEAIAWQESRFGELGHFARFEKAYGPGGPFWQAPHVRSLWQAYGAPAACSWGSWQILYVTAWELGFRGEPWWLVEDEQCIQWAIKYIQMRAIDKGAETVEQIADAYNSGSHRDPFTPEGYVTAVRKFYDEALEKRSA